MEHERPLAGLVFDPASVRMKVDDLTREMFVSLFLFSEVSEQPAHADVFGLMGLLGHIERHG